MFFFSSKISITSNITTSLLCYTLEIVKLRKHRYLKLTYNANWFCRLKVILGDIFFFTLNRHISIFLMVLYSIHYLKSARPYPYGVLPLWDSLTPHFLALPNIK